MPDTLHDYHVTVKHGVCRQGKLAPARFPAALRDVPGARDTTPKPSHTSSREADLSGSPFMQFRGAFR
jgi:hypothetical protein